MTDRESYQMFLALYEHLYDQEQIVSETTIVVQSIYKGLCEKFPDFDALYRKHHKRLTDGEQGRLNAKKLKTLADIIELLKKEA